MLASGEISPSDLIWRDGMSDWTPAGRVAEIASVAASPSMEAAPYTSPAPASYSAPTSYAAPSSYSPGQLPPPAGLAIASMCCGIASIVLSCCVPYISIFAAIAAIILGHKATTKIKANQASGAGMAKAGLITGYIGLVTSLLMLVYTIFVIMNPDFANKILEMQKQKIESQQR
jgi:hypothetical protein